jgi:hypothetical protein
MLLYLTVKPGESTWQIRDILPAQFKKKLRLAFGGKRESVLTFFFLSAFAGNKIAVGDLELLGNDFFTVIS